MDLNLIRSSDTVLKIDHLISLKRQVGHDLQELTDERISYNTNVLQAPSVAIDLDPLQFR